MNERCRALLLGLIATVAVWGAGPGQAQVAVTDTGYRQAVAEAAFGSEAMASFYRTRDYRPIFTGDDDLARRAALLKALREAPLHGLPVGRHDAGVLVDALRGVAGARDRGRAEGVAAQMFLALAQDLTSGALVPRRVDSNIVRSVERRDPLDLLEAFAAAENPLLFLRGLAPQSAEYNRLKAARLALEEVRRRGGWGPEVAAAKLSPGDRGDDVVVLRNRLIAMGYLANTAAVSYDRAIETAVQAFQADHGLRADGVAGRSTIQAVNVTVEDRLASVLVAMERERWLNGPRGTRHVLVNLTDYSSKIIDDDKVTFETRSVIGEIDPDTQTPEFSDMMQYLEINPDWTVPRGIIERDYLPRLQANAGALGHLNVVDRRGRTVPRSKVNFAAYTAANFPYYLKQAPGPRNALGTVKFMFPNRHAIYLHDTPDKSLFGRERRAFSNGCVRLNDPHEFAYELLAPQAENPKTLFDGILNSRRQTRVNLETPVPVHLIYRTAFTRAKGRINFRHDIYGRDARIWAALQRAGVRLDRPES